MATTFERGFALVAIVTLLVSVVAVVGTGAADAGRSNALAFDAPVPDEYSFTPTDERPIATVDGRQFESAQKAVNAADPGDTVTLTGRFEESVVVDTPNVTLTSTPGSFAVIDGGGHGNVLTVNGDDVTVQRVWVRNSGFDAASNDAGVWVNGTNTSVVDSRVTETTFGVWIDGVDGIRVLNNTIVGRESVRPLSYRGNGVQIWKTSNTVVSDNRITDVRDGLYYSWSSEVLAERNTMWDLRYGVHYMYTDDSTLRNNTAFDNDVGYALMVSQRLTIENNTAFNNSGGSGHGLLVKSVDETKIRNNSFVGNVRGLFVYNSLENEIVDNLVLENEIGVHLSAGSVRESVYGNSFIRNAEPVRVDIAEQVEWNATASGNYWSDARIIDVDGDAVSDVRHRPAGLVERLVWENPQAGVFAHSPAFDAIRLAENSVPLIESPGVVDHHPLTEPPHHSWKRYYARNRTH
ncbi:nitrous oxide reductase family maturation protein NosD [Haladaptatus sp. NG-SE-30]